MPFAGLLYQNQPSCPTPTTRVWLVYGRAQPPSPNLSRTIPVKSSFRDSNRNGNAIKLRRVGTEEVFQSLRMASSDGANGIGDVASLSPAFSFGGSKVLPEMREMIERVGIDVASHSLDPLLIGDVDVPYLALKHGAQGVDDLLYCGRCGNQIVFAF